jgi:DNA polymerase IV
MFGMPPAFFHSLFIDLNSFFASCEQQMDPRLRGRPVAVVPMMADTTSVLAASYPAKAFGVKTGTKVGDARRMCPGIVFITGNHDHYIRFHHQIHAAIDTVIPVDRVCSIDEFACVLLREERTEAGAVKIAKAVKRSILERCGEALTCSIGLAPNRFLGKIAADMKKPDGLTLLRKDELPGSLYDLELMDLPGIGVKMRERLHRAGISTVERLCSLSEKELRTAWGSVIGGEWYHRLRGEMLVEPKTVRRSIGHSHVLAPDRRGEPEARAVMVRLVSKVAQRARALEYVGSEFSIGVRFLTPRGEPRRDWGESVRLDQSAWGAGGGGGENDTGLLVRAMAEMWDRKPCGRMLQVWANLTGLLPRASATPMLFEERRDQGRLSKALDLINRKYGVDTLYPASMQSARKTAPRRIAFSNIPDLDLPDVSNDDRE